MEGADVLVEIKGIDGAEKAFHFRFLCRLGLNQPAGEVFREVIVGFRSGQFVDKHAVCRPEGIAECPRNMIRKCDRICRGTFAGPDAGKVGRIIIQNIGKILHGQPEGAEELIEMFRKQGRFVSDGCPIPDETFFSHRRKAGFGLQLGKTAAQTDEHLTVRPGDSFPAPVTGDYCT